MAEVINFKQLASEKHRVYRILRAGPNVINGYKKAIAKVGNYRGALIFPEQHLCLKDSNIFAVTTARKQDTTSVLVTRTGPFTLCDANNKEMKTVDDVISAELTGKEVDHGYSRIGLAYFILKNPSNAVSNQCLFADPQSDAETFWFSNKSDATSFAKSCIKLG